MFPTIIPNDLTDDNRAELLAAGLAVGALPTEQAAVALMLRLPHGVGLRDDVWRDYVLADEHTAAYTWPDLGQAAESGDLPLSRGERYLVRAACAIANPMVAAPLHRLATTVDRASHDLLIAALHHAAGRPNPADQLAERDAEIGELRRRLDGYAIADAAARDEIARLRAELAVRGTEDGNGEPVPDGVEGHPVGSHHTDGAGRPVLALWWRPGTAYAHLGGIPVQSLAELDEAGDRVEWSTVDPRVEPGVRLVLRDITPASDGSAR